MVQFIRLRGDFGLGFGFYRNGRTASQLLALREAARMVPNFCSLLFLAYGTCASAQVPRNFVGAQACQWRHGTLIAPQPATMSTIALVTACVPWP